MNYAVLFPGLGYGFDRPLFYYTKKMLLSAGYAIQQISYGQLPAFDAKNLELRSELLEKATLDSLEQIQSFSLNKAENVIFIGKSVGTVCLSRIVQKYQMSAKCVLFTPLEEALKTLVQDSIVFWGTKDPLVQNQALETLCKQNSLQFYKIDGANHSLETENTELDIQNLLFTVSRTREFLSL